MKSLCLPIRPAYIDGFNFAIFSKTKPHDMFRLRCVTEIPTLITLDGFIRGFYRDPLSQCGAVRMRSLKINTEPMIARISTIFV